jgi:hypothetical protein
MLNLLLLVCAITLFLQCIVHGDYTFKFSFRLNKFNFNTEFKLLYVIMVISIIALIMFFMQF